MQTQNSRSRSAAILLRRTLVIGAILWSSITVAATPLPKSEPVPGGVALIELTSEQLPAAYLNGHRVMVLPGDASGSWTAVVGIPLTARPGDHHLVLANGLKIAFAVRAKEYQKQHLTIANKRQVNPLAEDLERINRESAEMQAAFRHWESTADPVTRLAWPVNGPISSTFGLQRVLNEQPRSPHSGLDIAAAEGEPITAPAEGIIAVTGAFFFNGNTVLIDHGMGLVTMYCHMSRIDVAPGERVRGGDTLGAVGQTGRVTGPHLHWSVSINNARVDPNLFMAPVATTEEVP